jgi:tRNA A37 threonylcarbamoyladenosine modification protein TsaB
MTLFIDLSQGAVVHFALWQGKKRVMHRDYSLPASSHSATVSLLAKFLKESKITNKNIVKVTACKGPGSFSGTRIAVTIGQALGLAWHIPFSAVAHKENHI